MNSNHGWRAPKEVPTEAIPVHAAIHTVLGPRVASYQRSRIRRALVGLVQRVAATMVDRGWDRWWWPYAVTEATVALVLGFPFPGQVRYHWQNQQTGAMVWLDSPG
jgi:hypothetical protein